MNRRKRSPAQIRVDWHMTSDEVDEQTWAWVKRLWYFHKVGMTSGTHRRSWIPANSRGLAGKPTASLGRHAVRHRQHGRRP